MAHAGAGPGGLTGPGTPRLARSGQPSPLRAAMVLAIGFSALVLTGWAVGLSVRHLRGADLSVVRALAVEPGSAAAAVLRIVTGLGSAAVLIPVVAVVAIVLVSRRRPADAAILVVALAGAILLQDVIKVLVERPRPPVRHLVQTIGLSFPSGHALQAAAGWAAVAWVLTARTGRPRTRRAAIAAAVAIALVVAATRILLGVHYPTDAAAGLLLGWVWVVLTVRAFLAGFPNNEPSSLPEAITTDT